MRFFPLIFSCLTFAFAFACSHSKAPASDDPLEEKLNGPISYPFVKGQPLGINGKKEPFIVRSRLGETEYTIEIPDAGEEYNIEIPLAALQPPGKPQTTHDLSSVRATDQELTSAFPQLAQKAGKSAQLVDQAFGMGEVPSPPGAPSYVLGLAKINEFYRGKKYEDALIEIDHLLSAFPSSPKLHKMKGTVLVRIQDYALAEKAWTRALELDPGDKTLKKGLERLRAKLPTPSQ